MRRATSTMTVLMGACLHLMAQSADGDSLRPSFGADLTSEVQTDFEQVRLANLLQLHADIPLSKALSIPEGKLDGSLRFLTTFEQIGDDAGSETVEGSTTGVTRLTNLLSASAKKARHLLGVPHITML